MIIAAITGLIISNELIARRGANKTKRHLGEHSTRTHQFSVQRVSADDDAKLREPQNGNLSNEKFRVFAEGDVSVQKKLFGRLFADQPGYLDHQLQIGHNQTIQSSR